jgi:orotidine-5'-phosphate decarboxylase
MSDQAKIIVALDYAEATQAMHLVQQLDPSLCKLKVGKELFTSAGPDLVRDLVKRDFKVFLDLKFHDIPNTVAKACAAACDMGVWMLNVHASGGLAMMQAAQKAVEDSKHPAMLIAVTVLTSMSEAELKQVGVQQSLTEQVKQLALLTQQAGLAGVVCSAQEASMLRAHCAEEFCLVTPGIRPADSAKDDQTRIVTPSQALALGSSYLVIGRPITQAANPLLALQQIQQSLQS